MEAAALDELRASEDEHWWFRARRRALRPLVQTALELAPPGPVLDLGCGTGGNLAHLFGGTRRTLLGLDREPVALAHCARRTAHVSGPDAWKLLRAEGCRLPLADGSVAVISAFDLLEHLPDDAACLREIARVLAPGGQLIASVPAWPALWSAHDEALSHVRRYARGELEQRLAGAGLELERRRGFNLLLLPPIALVRWLRRDANGTDFRPTSPLASTALAALFAVERALQRCLGLPLGLSLCVRARRG